MEETTNTGVSDTSLQIRVATSSNRETSESSDPWTQNYIKYREKPYVEDNLGYLLDTERPVARMPSMRTNNRAMFIDWMVEVNGEEGDPGIIQAACWYLDSILAVEESHQSDSNRQYVLAVASFCIATKIRSGRGTRLILSSIANLPQWMVVLAEREILQKLGFPPQPIIPQDYIAYLVWYSKVEDPAEIEKAATFLCVAGMMTTTKLCIVYPSVIACAAVKFALATLRGMTPVEVIEKSPLYKTAERATGDINKATKILKKAAYNLGVPNYVYNAPLQIYGVWPQFFKQ